MKIGVCTKAKNEEKIISDWVNHYLKLDFDKIIIYDDNSLEPTENTLKRKNIINDKITILNSNQFSQTDLYKDCIESNKDLNWLLLCDADEFLWIKDKKTIKQWLELYNNDVCSIFINWLTYGTGKRKVYDYSLSVYKQFTVRENYNCFWNNFTKSFIRPKLIERVSNVHETYNKKYKIYNVYNKPINLSNNLQYKDKYYSDNTPVVLIHYMTLDIESMLLKNKKNKDGGLLTKNDFKYSFEWYKDPTFGFKDSCVDYRMIKYE